MRNLIAVIFLALITSSTFGQINITKLERVDGLWTKKGESEPYSGEFIETFENGETKGIGTLINGQLEGLRIRYYPNGNKKTEKIYKDAYPHGLAQEFYEDGTLKQEGEFIDNKENGLWIVYYPNGNIQASLTFENGIQIGPHFEYNTKGILTNQYYFRNGKAEYSDEFMELLNKASEMTGRFIPEETIQLYDKAIELNPTVAKVYFSRGTAYSNIFEYEKAINDYDKALELNPNYMEVYANRGSAKINQFTSNGILDPTPEQTSSACEDFRKAKELGDSSYSEDMIYLYCKKNKDKKKRKKKK